MSWITKKYRYFNIVKSIWHALFFYFYKVISFIIFIILPKKLFYIFSLFYLYFCTEVNDNYKMSTKHFPSENIYYLGNHLSLSGFYDE